jgi:hypothetical protein
LTGTAVLGHDPSPIPHRYSSWTILMRVLQLFALLLVLATPAFAQAPTIRAVVHEDAPYTNIWIVGGNFGASPTVTIAGYAAPTVSVSDGAIGLQIPEGLVPQSDTWLNLLVSVTTAAGTANFEMLIPARGFRGQRSIFFGDIGDTGPQGPPGPAGPQGLPGAPGSPRAVVIDGSGRLVGSVVRMLASESALLTLKVNSALGVLAEAHADRLRATAPLLFESGNCTGQAWIGPVQAGPAPLAPPASNNAPDGMLYIANTFAASSPITVRSQWNFDDVSKTSTCAPVNATVGNYFVAYPLMDLNQFAPPFRMLVP